MERGGPAGAVAVESWDVSTAALRLLSSLVSAPGPGGQPDSDKKEGSEQIAVHWKGLVRRRSP